MSLSEEPECDSSSKPGEEKPRKNGGVTTTSWHKKRLIREVMRDVFVSVILLLLTTLVTYGDFQSSPTSSILASGPLTRPSRPPQPLFTSADSYIDDYFTGDIFSAFEEADDYENAFIIFYAPWDADCIRAVDILETVAKVFVDNDIYFAAVNCWEPNGQCHTEFSSGNKKSRKNPRLVQHQYPIFIFYPKDRHGIQYNGPISVQSILEFLLLARKPTEHIGSKKDLLYLRAKHDGQALVGYFPDLMHNGKSRRSLKRFLDAVFQFLELDPFQSRLGGVGIVTSERVAYQLQLDSSRPLRYFFWNGTSVVYPNKTISSSHSLVTWAQNQISNNKVTWIGTSGRKSLTLSRRLEKDSRYSLLVFLERKPSRVYNEALRIVNSVALQYFTCDEPNDDQDASNLLKAMQDQDRMSFVRQGSLQEQCWKDPWFAQHFGDIKRPPFNTSLQGDVHKDWLLRLPHKVSPKRPLIDSKVVELRRMAQRLDCSLMASTRTVRSSEEEEDCDRQGDFDVFDEDQPFVWGLGCRDNRSLNFYVLDSVTQWSLVHNLAIFHDDHKVPKVVIISLNDEKIFAMEQEFNAKNLENFVRQFHEDQNSLKALKLAKKKREEEKEEIVEEIHADNFKERLLTSHRRKPVVLLYTSRSCAFCQVANHVFQTLRRLISPDILDLVSVDAADNDLPWGFTALAVPSVLFFSNHSNLINDTAETRAFPMSKRLSVPNLLSFIVANLDGETRVKLALSICGDDCLPGTFQPLQQQPFAKKHDDHDVEARMMTPALAKDHDEL